MSERTHLATAHEQRSARRAGLLEARQALGRAEREFVELGPGDEVPGPTLLLRAAGSCVATSATQVVEVRERVELRQHGAHREQVAGDLVHRGRRLLAFDLAGLVGVSRVAPREATVVIFTAAEPFALVVDDAALGRGPVTLVPGDPGSPGRAWRHTRVFVRCDDAVLPLLDVDALSRAAAARAASQDDTRARTELRFLEEVEVVERLLASRGLSLCARLREQLRTYCRAAAAERREPPYLPRILGGDTGAVCGLLESIATGDTSFFRDAGQLEALARRLLHVADGGRALRLWSAACATGEEAWSLAMLLASARPLALDRVLATDLSPTALAYARRGAYSRGAVVAAHPLLARFLAPADGGLEVAGELRVKVTYRVADLRDPAPERDLDAIVCRHALELLEPAVAARAVRTLVGALRPGGYLLLGCTETSLADGLGLERLDEAGAVLFRRPPGVRGARMTRLGAGHAGSPLADRCPR